MVNTNFKEFNKYVCIGSYQTRIAGLGVLIYARGPCWVWLFIFLSHQAVGKVAEDNRGPTKKVDMVRRSAIGTQHPSPVHPWWLLTLSRASSSVVVGAVQNKPKAGKERIKKFSFLFV